jgi:hypothetical protein
MFMVRSATAILLFVFLAICAVQTMGAACSDDCLRHWSSAPHHAHEQYPGAQDSQTEPDGSEGESALEVALSQGDGLPVIHLTTYRVVDSTLRPRSAFPSDLFRPPTGI